MEIPMLVSWNWLGQYVALDMPHRELTRRLMMAGLNHESTEPFGDDWTIDLEVTSNRPDCLGHLGVAREIAVLWEKELRVPSPCPAEGKTPAADLVRVRIDCPDLCSRYTARVIRGAKVGPSPAWLVQRLAAVGIAAINNVVDVTNYVLMECGQPLHAFDLAKLQGPEIVVRRPRGGERMEAIDHKTYDLAGEMCVIADARDAVAIGGVMGGAATEVTQSTRDLLIEAAEFDPVSIRNTSRKLSLRSDSSYRFERKIDPEGVDWASRRCCELILELAGGELARGAVDVGRQPAPREPVRLRYAQVPRLLGIEVSPQRCRAILAALGLKEVRADEAAVEVIPPSWRRDITREADLIEEVARIHGYENIPEDVRVPMAATSRTRDDRVLARVRHALTAAGFDEAMTISALPEALSDAFSPWTEMEALRTFRPVLGNADRLRRTLVPSLLAARRANEGLSNPRIELFEIAKVYLPREGQLPQEETMLALTSGRDFRELKGVLESLLTALRDDARLEALPASHALFDPAAACDLELDGQRVGYVGRLRTESLKPFGLRGATTVAELRLAPLVALAELVARSRPLSTFPSVARDLNLVVDDAVRWADVAATVRSEAGAMLESLDYRDTYRDAERLGEGKKSLLLSITLRPSQGTLTSAEADALRDRVVAACRTAHGAELR